jgi:hypothetical protein
MINIAKDEIILISSGEYSDYSIYGLLVALKDINTSEVRNDYINLHPEQTEGYSFKEDMFMEYLKELDLIKVIPFKEWYLSSYSKIAHMNVTNGPMLFT